MSEASTDGDSQQIIDEIAKQFKDSIQPNQQPTISPGQVQALLNLYGISPNSLALPINVSCALQLALPNAAPVQLPISSNPMQALHNEIQKPIPLHPDQLPAKTPLEIIWELFSTSNSDPALSNNARPVSQPSNTMQSAASIKNLPPTLVAASSTLIPMYSRQNDHPVLRSILSRPSMQSLQNNGLTQFPNGSSTPMPIVSTERQVETSLLSRIATNPRPFLGNITSNAMPFLTSATRTSISTFPTSPATASTSASTSMMPFSNISNQMSYLSSNPIQVLSNTMPGSLHSNFLNQLPTQRQDPLPGPSTNHRNRSKKTLRCRNCPKCRNHGFATLSFPKHRDVCAYEKCNCTKCRRVDRSRRKCAAYNRAHAPSRPDHPDQLKELNMDNDNKRPKREHSMDGSSGHMKIKKIKYEVDDEDVQSEEERREEIQTRSKTPPPCLIARGEMNAGWVIAHVQDLEGIFDDEESVHDPDQLQLPDQLIIEDNPVPLPDAPIFQNALNVDMPIPIGVIEVQNDSSDEEVAEQSSPALPPNSPANVSPISANNTISPKLEDLKIPSSEPQLQQKKAKSVGSEVVPALPSNALHNDKSFPQTQQTPDEITILSFSPAPSSSWVTAHFSAPYFGSNSTATLTYTNADMPMPSLFTFKVQQSPLPRTQRLPTTVNEKRKSSQAPLSCSHPNVEPNRTQSSIEMPQSSYQGTLGQAQAPQDNHSPQNSFPPASTARTTSIQADLPFGIQRLLNTPDATGPDNAEETHMGNQIPNIYPPALPPNHTAFQMMPRYHQPAYNGLNTLPFGSHGPNREAVIGEQHLPYFPGNHFRNDFAFLPQNLFPQIQQPFTALWANEFSRNYQLMMEMEKKRKEEEFLRKHYYGC